MWYHVSMISTNDLLTLVLAIAVVAVAIFLCWTLVELARLLHQANDVLTEAREKITRLERAALAIKEKLTHSVNYLGIIAEGGRSLLSMFQNRKETKKRRKSQEEE